MIKIGDFVRSYSGGIAKIDEYCVGAALETMQRFPKLNAFSVGERIACPEITGSIQNIYFEKGKFLYDITSKDGSVFYNIKEEDLLPEQTLLPLSK